MKEEIAKIEEEMILRRVKEIFTKIKERHPELKEWELKEMMKEDIAKIEEEERRKMLEIFTKIKKNKNET